MSKLQGFSWAELNALFAYGPDTGLITRRVARSHNSLAGCVVGTVDGKGYLHVNVSDKFIRLHRLAWFLVHGEVPRSLDHINNIKTDNRLVNLRPCNQKQNSGNIRPPKHNTSGVKGVSWNTRRGRWHAQIKIDGKQTYLGGFHDKEEAAAAYASAARLHFGDYAKTSTR